MKALADTGKTGDPYLAAVLQAGHVNRACGANVKPWELDQAPEEFLEACTALVVDLPALRSHRARVEQANAAWRNKHPALRRRNR